MSYGEISEDYHALSEPIPTGVRCKFKYTKNLPSRARIIAVYDLMSAPKVVNLIG